MASYLNSTSFYLVISLVKKQKKNILSPVNQITVSRKMTSILLQKKHDRERKKKKKNL